MKKIFALLITAAMAVGLAACNRSAAPSATPTPTPTPAPAAQTATPSPATPAVSEPAPSAAESYGEYDGRGIFKYNEPVTITAIARYNTTYVNDPQDLWLYHWASDKMNINFVVEGVPNEAAQERTGIIFASGDLPDVLLNWSDLGNLTACARYGDNEKQLRALNDLMYDPEIMPNFYAINQDRPQPLELCKTVEGNIYGFPRYFQDPRYSTAYSGTGLWYDTTVFSDVGYQSAPETLEGMLEALMKIKQTDPRGLGENNIPMGGSLEYQDFSHIILQAMGLLNTNVQWGYTVMDASTSKDYRMAEFSYLKTHPKYYEYLKAMRLLYENGLMDQDYFTLDDSTVKAKITEGHNAVFAANNTTNLATIEWQNWDLVGPLTSALNDTKLWPVNNGPGGLVYTAFVTTDCGDFEYEAFMRFMDLAYSEECGDLYFAGPEVDVDDTYGLTGGWYWKEDMENVERVFLDVEAGKFPAWGGYVNFVSPFGPPGNKADRATDGSEVQYYDKNTVSGYFNLKTIEKLNPYYIYNIYGIVYDSDTSIKVEDFQDLFNDMALAETAKFITGLRPLNDAEWDKYVSDIRALGLDEYESIIREAQGRLK